MRNVGLIAFSVTTCVLVPAAIHRLSAGKEQIAKLSAPSEDSFELRGAKVKVALDRHMIDPGESLKIHIAATEAKGKTLEVGVLVLGSNGSEGDRVPSPPSGVAFRILKLPIKDGVATGDMSVALKGASQNEYRPFGHYEVLVGAPNAIEKLENLRRRSDLIGGDEGIPWLNKAGSKFMGLYRGWGNVDEAETSPYQEGQLARLDAHTRPKSNAITLTVPDKASVDQSFMVSVTLKNPGRRAMKNLEVSLGESSGADDEYNPYASALHTDIEPGSTKITLAPHETRTLQFKVTPTTAGVFGFYAHARCETNYEDEKACKDVQALQLGAFDATEVMPVEEKAPAVVVR